VQTVADFLPALNVYRMVEMVAKEWDTSVSDAVKQMLIVVGSRCYWKNIKFFVYIIFLMGSAKAKGTRYERELVKAFWDAGFGVVRAPTSGGATSRALPDIVAGNGKVYYAIEVKMKKNLPIYIREEQVEEIKEFSRRFGAKAFVAVKLPYKEWRFVPVEVISKNGKNYKVGEEEYLKGLKLENLLEG